MDFSIRKLFSNLFLSIVCDENDCYIYGRVFKHSKVIKTIEAKFENINDQDSKKKMQEYVLRQEKLYHDTYIALFFNEGSQGALPTTNISEYGLYGVSSDGLININVGDDFSIYTDASSLNKARHMFENLHIDLMYSPIALMYEEILKHEISKKTNMYIYSHNDSFALGIFRGRELCFATFFKVNEPDTADVVDSFDDEDISDITNLIAFEEDAAKSLDDFQSLDDFLKGDDDSFADIDYDINMPESSDVAASVAIFGRDMNIFSYIVAAIKEFYHNPVYNGTFIEKIVIFDNAHVSATFLQYLQTELLVETQVFSINTAKLINDLMQKDIVL